MSSQQFFGISFILGVVLAIYFLFPRSKQSPSRLKLSFRRNLPETMSAAGISAEAREVEKEIKIGLHFQNDPMANVKNLNVMFNYNGHTWDAFEVLGVPAGAKPPMVEAAYKQALKSTDKTAHDFIKTAYDAIRKTR